MKAVLVTLLAWFLVALVGLLALCAAASRPVPAPARHEPARD